MTRPDPADRDFDGIHDRPVEILRDLVRFDTQNPPGDERACVEYVAGMLDHYGVESEEYAKDPHRPNLVARVEGGVHASEASVGSSGERSESDGDAPTLVLYGHVDVVPVDEDAWTHPPFDAVVEDGWVWGRGTLDMKGGVAMLLSAFLRAAVADDQPAGDVMLVVLADEEAGGEYGAEYLTDEHPELFADADYAIGEFGGFPMSLAGERFFPIQVSEKQVCWLRVRWEGQGGHAAFPREGAPMVEMGRALDALDGERLPVHVTPPVAEMIDAMADALPLETADALRALTDPERTDAVLDDLGGDATMLDALLHNTASPTVARAGEKENVIPGSAELTLDCRLLPGFEPADVIPELRPYVGDDAEFEVIRFDPGPENVDLGLYDTLAGVLDDSDADGTPIPFALFASTDARHLARVGVQSYGFLPMDLPDDFAFMDTVHAPDERVPVEAIEFGADRIYEVVQRYDGE
jgi:acetylornithine deacetylase/succinyl-diaminopimelate desuccinylase-like protein